MAEASWPSPNHASGAVTDTEYEQLVHPQAPEGMVGSPADTSTVFGDSTGMQVKVRANRFGLVRGHLWSSGASEFTKSVTANSSGSTRIDLVVLRLTRSTSDVTIVVKAGTPGAGAPSPTLDLGTTGTYEVPLAEVTVINNASTITAAQVTRREWYLGENLIVCTATTRPPHAPGRRIWDTAVGIEYVSNGTTWGVTHEDTGTVAVTPAPGWDTSGGGYCTVRRRNGFVMARWSLTRTGGAIAVNGDATLFTVPSGYAPPQVVSEADSQFNTGSYARFQVAATTGVASLLDHSGVGTGQAVGGSLMWMV